MTGQDASQTVDQPYSEQLPFSLPGGKSGVITLIAPRDLITEQVRQEVVRQVEEKWSGEGFENFDLAFQTVDLRGLYTMGLVARDQIKQLPVEVVNIHLSSER